LRRHLFIRWSEGAGSLFVGVRHVTERRREHKWDDNHVVPRLRLETESRLQLDGSAA
jgi:hypothetical protein